MGLFKEFKPEYIYRDLSKESGYPCFTVGYYDENGHWEPESDHESAVKAMNRVMELSND